MVWDPNLQDFSGKFLKPQGLGTSAVGRSDFTCPVGSATIQSGLAI